MKQIFSFILAALLLSSALTACGNGGDKETTASETNGIETKAPETAEVPDEGEDGTYDPSLMVENGVAKAKIVVAEGADSLLTLAAEELQYHIRKVSGAEVEFAAEAPTSCLPIILATPESNPEIEALFADDLAYLRDLGEEGSDTRWGDDGFAIRTTEKAVYIFGATPRGTLNGVYDFIEENLGVMWVRADEETGLLYDEMSTITVTAANYREKSPFDLRALIFYGGGDAISVPTTELMLSRNKLNGFRTIFNDSNALQRHSERGIIPFVSDHNIKSLVLQSPLYDPNNNEYWETDPDGNHLTFDTSAQVNIWSDLTVDAVAATVISVLDSSPIPLEHFGICLQDTLMNFVFPECTVPFEYAPGEFIEPNYNYESDYYSTVFFTFLNKVADKVAEKYPDVMIHTYAYYQTLNPPRCELRDNVAVVFCSIYEDLSQPYNAPQGQYPEQDWAMLQKWFEKTDNVILYNYYGCCYTMGWYERPIWYRMQDDLQHYATKGILGLEPCSYYDSTSSLVLDHYSWGYTNKDNWDTNMMTYWLMTKLSWNPYEDVDALIEYYCEKVYRDAADEMLEYYRILKMGWDDGADYLYSQFNANIRWNSPTADIYFNFLDTEVDGVYIIEALGEALNKAWEAADDRAKEFIARRRECLTEEAWNEFLEYTANFK